LLPFTIIGILIVQPSTLACKQFLPSIPLFSLHFLPKITTPLNRFFKPIDPNVNVHEFVWQLEEEREEKRVAIEKEKRKKVKREENAFSFLFPSFISFRN